MKWTPKGFAVVERIKNVYTEQRVNYMHEILFLHDLAAVMIVAGMVTLLFHRLKQPVVLGYLLAGFIIGPNTPPFSFIHDEATIQIMADLGVVFLMFSLGLEFSFRKLRRVGLSPLLIAAFEILVMTFSGYLLGSMFGWSKADCVFLGIMLSLTSTMIVVKGLRDRGEIHSKHAEMIAGVNLSEDIFVILLMVALPGFALTGSLPTVELVMILSKLFIFLVAAVVVGLLLVPRLLRYIVRYTTEETLLIVSLGLCFGLSLFALKIQLSAALGAFLIGAIVAESREVGRITNLMIPLRDMFCAVFFVAIGMQIDPHYLADSIIPAVIITVVYIIVKVMACAGGAFMTGTDAKTSMRVGTNMAQLGEFAFILATLGAQLNLTSDFLYPLIVITASINAMIRPYLVDNADRIAVWVGKVLPDSVVNQMTFFRRRAASLGSQKPKKSVMRHVWSLTVQLSLNMALIAGGFIMAGYINKMFPELFSFLPDFGGGSQGLIWLGTAVLLLPLYVATFRKMQAMSMMLSELMTRGSQERRMNRVLRSTLGGGLFLIQIMFLTILTLIVSAALLPPWQTLIVLLFIIAFLIFKFGRDFNRWYSEGKFALVATLNEPIAVPDEPVRPAVTHLSDAHMKKVVVQPGTVECKLIREIELRTITGASIVALERNGQTTINPGPDTEVLAGDELLLIGDHQQLIDAIRLFTPNALQDS